MLMKLIRIALPLSLLTAAACNYDRVEDAVGIADEVCACEDHDCAVTAVGKLEAVLKNDRAPSKEEASKTVQALAKAQACEAKLRPAEEE